MATGFKFHIQEVEELNYMYLCSKKKGADQLHDYCAADLRLFSHMQKAGFLMMQLISVSTISYM